MQAAVQAHQLAKRYGAVEAVRGIDLDVAPGEAFGFLGPNGAGKSTTLAMLTTLTAPSAGSARVGGYDVVNERDAVRRHIGLVFQETTLDGYLSAEQNLRFHAELHGLSKVAVAGRMRSLMQTMGLWERRGALVRTYSGGMKRRLEIVRALLHAPRVLFLDEPTLGLDPQARAAIWAHLRTLREREQVTVFMTTHYLDEAECCDRIAIVDDGRIVVEGAPHALKTQIGHDRIRLSTVDDGVARSALKARFGLDAKPEDDGLVFAVQDGEHFVPRLCTGLGVPIRRVSVDRPTLDDVFLAHTGTTLRDAQASAHERARSAPMGRPR